MTTKTRRTFTDEFKRRGGSAAGRQRTAFDAGGDGAGHRALDAACLAGPWGDDGGAGIPPRQRPSHWHRRAIGRAGRDPPPAEGARSGADGTRHFKKCHCHLLGPAEMRFRFIEDHRAVFMVRVMCAMLEVSASGYYAWRSRPCRAPAPRAIGRWLMISAASTPTADAAMAARASTPLLRAKDRRVGRNWIARLMRRHGVHARCKRRFRTTTDSNHAFPLAPNLLARQFTAAAPNRVWLADITYVPTEEGWLYLAVVLDLFARKVVGWAMAQTMPQELTLAALRMAITNWRPDPRLHAPLGPWQPVRRARLSPPAGRARDDLLHEPQGRLLGQRSDGKLLRQPQDRARGTTARSPPAKPRERPSSASSKASTIAPRPC